MPTLSNRSWRVGAVWQLVGLQAWHRWCREPTRDKVVKRHQLIGSCLLPPPGSSVAEPHLKVEEPFTYFLNQQNNFHCIESCVNVFSIFGSLHGARSIYVYVCVRPICPTTGSWTDRDLNIWRVQWNHRHYISMCYCKFLGSDNARGLLCLLKPTLAKYLSQESI